jgi:hypothetical protein
MDGVSSRSVLLREKINIVGNQLCLNVLIVFKPGVVFRSKARYYVVHSVLDSRLVKERGIAFTLF